MRVEEPQGDKSCYGQVLVDLLKYTDNPVESGGGTMDFLMNGAGREEFWKCFSGRPMQTMRYKGD